MHGWRPWDAVVDPADTVIDLRSDAVTRPNNAMWQAMHRDHLDWSRFGDRTVEQLEARAAQLLGVEAVLFVPSGTMANTLTLLVATDPGEAFLVDEVAHVLRAEDDAYRRLARVHPLTFPSHDGMPDLGALERAVGHDVVERDHGRPRLLWLENTHTWFGGAVLPPADVAALGRWAEDRHLHLHIDGARLWNAAAALGVCVAQLTTPSASVVVNLSKGLGCPAGALLGGSAHFIVRARQRMVGLGGGLAQAGLLAACGLVALNNPIEALRTDHRNARRLADGLRQLGAATNQPATNIVLVTVDDAERRCRQLAARGVLAMRRDASTVRMVTHRDVDEAMINEVIDRWQPSDQAAGAP